MGHNVSGTFEVISLPFKLCTEWGLNFGIDDMDSDGYYIESDEC